MTDEAEDAEALRIAQGLTDREWELLSFNRPLENGHWASTPMHNGDSNCVRLGLLETFTWANSSKLRVRCTHLGKKVWAWHALFWDGDHD